MRRSRWGGRVLIGLALLAAGCAGPPPSRPPGQSIAVPLTETIFVLALPTLPKRPVFERYTSSDGRYLEEVGRWDARSSDEATAGLLFSQASPGPPLTDPSAPEASLALWPALRDKRPALGRLVDSRNALGPVQWRRAGVGTSACVLFLQRWQRDNQSPPDAKDATLSGFYCNPPGVTLAPGAAETIVRSIGLRSLAKRP